MKVNELILILSVFILVQIVIYILLFNPRRKVHKIRPEDILHPEAIQKIWQLAKELESTLEKLDKATKHN